MVEPEPGQRLDAYRILCDLPDWGGGLRLLRGGEHPNAAQGREGRIPGFAYNLGKLVKSNHVRQLPTVYLMYETFKVPDYRQIDRENAFRRHDWGNEHRRLVF